MVPVAAVADTVAVSRAFCSTADAVLDEPENVCVAVNVCAIPKPATVALDDGNVIVVLSVPASVRLLLIVSVLLSTPANVVVALCVTVLPSAIVSVEPVAGAVIVTLLMLVAVATPRVGVTSVGLVENTRLVLEIGRAHV